MVNRTFRRRLDRIAVEVGVGKEPRRAARVIEDREPQLPVIPRPMICLNSVMELTIRAIAMFLQVWTSTPVVRSFEVVTTAGVTVSSSWNRLRCPRPTSPSSATMRTT
jgi:hypothetical protein